MFKLIVEVKDSTNSIRAAIEKVTQELRDGLAVEKGRTSKLQALVEDVAVGDVKGQVTGVLIVIIGLIIAAIH